MKNPDELHIRVCRGINCSIFGAGGLVQWCEDLIANGIPMDFDVSQCTGNCKESPVVAWNGEYLTQMSTEKLTIELMKEDGTLDRS